MEDRKADGPDTSWFTNTAKQIREKLKSKPKEPIDNLETELEYKERWRSIHIVYFTMFLISLGFSIILTGVWPYLDKLDPSAGKEFMGYIVAANPLGQMIFSPLVGWLCNRIGSIRIPLIVSLVVFTIASAGYSSLEVFDHGKKWWMLGVRFLVGVSSANIAACRSYLSAATRESERTNAVSMISLAQVLGFIVGPAIQAAVVPLGDEGIWLIPKKLHLNMYTSTGWINVFLAVFNIYLFMPHVFKEHKIAAREAMIQQGKDNESDTWNQQKPNYFATWTLIVSFFVIVFNFMLLETLGTPLTMDQFGWTKSESLEYMGILMSVGAVLAILTFALIGPLCKRYPEAEVMVFGGFLFMFFGRLVYIPLGVYPPPWYNVDYKRNMTIACDRFFTVKTHTALEIAHIRQQTYNCGDLLLGCPSTQEWCNNTPAMTLWQFIVGYLLTALGYPIGVTLIQTIFSKALGPRPQGVWMGLMTGSGSLSRVMGPVFVTHVYEEYGTVWTFGVTALMMFGCSMWLLYYSKALKPYIQDTNDDGFEGEELSILDDTISIKWKGYTQDDEDE